MNRCKPDKMDTIEYGKMLKRILISEEGRVPDRNASGWTMDGRKEESLG